MRIKEIIRGTNTGIPKLTHEKQLAELSKNRWQVWL